MIERPDGSFTTLLAKERIYVDKPGQIGAKELLYVEGDSIREADAIALGMIDPDTKELVRVEKKAQKADDGPREAKAPAEPGGKVPRDKAMRGPREKKETQDG